MTGLGSIGTMVSGAGGRYLFDAVTGDLLHTFHNPTPANIDTFSNSVAISGDKVLLGASWTTRMSACD